MPTTRRPLVLGSDGGIMELPATDTITTGSGMTLSAGVSVVNINLIAGATVDITVPLNAVMPDTNYEATAFLVVSAAILGSTQVVHPAKTKAVSSVTFTLKNTGLVTLVAAVTIVAVVGKVSI